MKIIKIWIVKNHQLLVKTKNGDYLLGTTTNCYAFHKIEKEKAKGLIANNKKGE